MLDLTKVRDAHVDQRLRIEPIIWLNSVRPDGRPHSVPVWFLWDGTTFLIFSRPNNQKIRNLRQNKYVTLALDGTKEGGDVVLFEGEAELLNTPGQSMALPAFAEKYAADMKEMGMTAEKLAAEFSQGIRVRPSRYLGWGE